MKLKYCDIARLIESDENFSNNDIGLIRAEVLKQILLCETNIPISNNKDKLTEKTKLDFIHKLKSNNHEVEYEKIERIINICLLDLTNKSQWLFYDNVQQAFKNHILNETKKIYKSPELKEELFNFYFSLLQNEQILSLKKKENRKLFKDVFKNIIENKDTKTDIDIAYTMLINIVFSNKENLPLDFVQEIGAIYLTNQVLTDINEYKAKLETIDNWLAKQDLSICYKYNKELKDILEKNEFNDLLCTKIFIDYVTISRDKKLTTEQTEQLKKAYNDAVKVLSEKVLETEDITDFIIQEKKNILVIYISYIKPNSYVNVIKKFFKHYTQEINNFQNMNEQYAEKLFLKCKIENSLDKKNSRIKINKI